MIRLTTDEELRKKLVARGTLQSAKYSWKTMAGNVLDVYREIGSRIT
jgi:glycosyltransferase involved in cell wall biosynthesis